MTQDSPEIRDKTIRETLVIPLVGSEPDAGIYQPSFPMTEADFLRLGKSNSVLTALGGAVLMFGLQVLLPLMLEYVRSQNATLIVTADLAVGVIAFLVGMTLLIIGFAFSRDRRQVLKKIRKHFRDYPGRVAVRMKK
jgi:hypothetical protein